MKQIVSTFLFATLFIVCARGVNPVTSPDLSHISYYVCSRKYQ